MSMHTVRDIEKSIQNLPPEGLAEFRAWFAEFDAGCWDQQLESDAKNGALERMSAKAIAEFQSGQCKEL